MSDKATEGRTEAAAVDQAIADVERVLRWVGDGDERSRSLAALRVLADAVAELRGDLRDLERALEWYAERRNHASPAGTPSMPPSSGGWLGTNDSFDGDGPGARARAALAAARSRDPQEPQT